LPAEASRLNWRRADRLTSANRTRSDTCAEGGAAMLSMVVAPSCARTPAPAARRSRGGAAAQDHRVAASGHGDGLAGEEGAQLALQRGNVHAHLDVVDAAVVRGVPHDQAGCSPPPCPSPALARGHGRRVRHSGIADGDALAWAWAWRSPWRFLRDRHRLRTGGHAPSPIPAITSPSTPRATAGRVASWILVREGGYGALAAPVGLDHGSFFRGASSRGAAAAAGAGDCSRAGSAASRGGCRPGRPGARPAWRPSSTSARLRSTAGSALLGRQRQLLRLLRRHQEGDDAHGERLPLLVADDLLLAASTVSVRAEDARLTAVLLCAMVRSSGHPRPGVTKPSDGAHLCDAPAARAARRGSGRHPGPPRPCRPAAGHSGSLARWVRAPAPTTCPLRRG
jgi:hypothetical protein